MGSLGSGNQQFAGHATHASARGSMGATIHKQHFFPELRSRFIGHHPCCASTQAASTSKATLPRLLASTLARSRSYSPIVASVQALPSMSIQRYEPVVVQQEDGEDPLFPGASKGKWTAVAVNLQRPEDPELHCAATPRSGPPPPW